jgi:hypothetical protein
MNTTRYQLLVAGIVVAASIHAETKVYADPVQIMKRKKKPVYTQSSKGEWKLETNPSNPKSLIYEQLATMAKLLN